jgi:hypothetical protein
MHDIIQREAKPVDVQELENIPSSGGHRTTNDKLKSHSAPFVLSLGDNKVDYQHTFDTVRALRQPAGIAGSRRGSVMGQSQRYGYYVSLS